MSAAGSTESLEQASGRCHRGGITRWNKRQAMEIASRRIDAFLAELVGVSKRHGLSVSHQDKHGAFEVVAFSEDAASWLMDAHDAR